MDTLTQHACAQVKARKRGWEAACKVGSAYIKAMCGTEDSDLSAGEPSFAAAATAASGQEAAPAPAAMTRQQRWLRDSALAAALAAHSAFAASAPAFMPISAGQLRRKLQATPAKTTASPSSAEQVTCSPHRTLPLPVQWKAPMHLSGSLHPNIVKKVMVYRLQLQGNQEDKKYEVKEDSAAAGGRKGKKTIKDLAQKAGHGCKKMAKGIKTGLQALCCFGKPRVMVRPCSRRCIAAVLNVHLSCHGSLQSDGLPTDLRTLLYRRRCQSCRLDYSRGPRLCSSAHYKMAVLCRTPTTERASRCAPKPPSTQPWGSALLTNCQRNSLRPSSRYDPT